MIASAISSMIPRQQATASPDSPFWYRPIGMGTPAGIDVSPQKSMSVSAVYGCNRVRRESLASLPWKVYRETGPDSKETARDYYLWEVLHDRPNRWQTPIEFKEMAVTHIDFRGNFYCRIAMFGNRMELIPLDPDRMKVTQRDNWSLEYKYQAGDGSTQAIPEADIYHVRGFSLDGVTGVGIVEYARNVIGSAIAQETHGATLFRNGGLNPLWISRPSGKNWTSEAKKNFRENWRRVNKIENTGVPNILLDGMELHELGLSNRDSQWIESRGFTAEEICRFFGVPPYMIGIKANAAYSSVEQQGQEFVNYTLGPLACRLEQAADRDLVTDTNVHTKIVLDGLLRGDLKSRYEAHNIAIQGGWKTKNEVRKMEELNPKEGGDDLQQALNMQPAGGGPDQNEQGGQPGKGSPKEPDGAEAITDAQKRVKIDDVFAVLLSDAADRIASAEVSGLRPRADKAGDDHTRWCEWASGIYAKHQRYITRVIEPLCRAYETGTKRTIDTEALTSQIIELKEAVFDQQNDMLALLDQWETTRADEVLECLRCHLFQS